MMCVRCAICAVGVVVVESIFNTPDYEVGNLLRITLLRITGTYHCITSVNERALGWLIAQPNRRKISLSK